MSKSSNSFVIGTAVINTHVEEGLARLHVREEEAVEQRLARGAQREHRAARQRPADVLAQRVAALAQLLVPLVT